MNASTFMREIGSKPLVSVIIATYNSSQTLKLSIESVLAQDFTDYEVWVVGDACTDNSQQIVNSFADTRLNWTNLPVNSGSQGAPNNEGIRRAKGEFIAYLGHDDLWFPWHLSVLMSFIQETKADLVHPLSAVIGPSGLKHVVGPPGPGKTYENHFVFPSCWLHQRSLVDECGPWRDQLQLSRGLDKDFLRLVHVSGKRISFFPRLGLLKFPSEWWGTYASGFQPGQGSYLERMKDDPLKLQHELLLEASLLLSRQWYPKTPLRQTLLELLHSLRRKMMDLYGEENWPLSQIRFWNFQRVCRRSRKKRGLKPYPPM